MKNLLPGIIILIFLFGVSACSFEQPGMEGAVPPPAGYAGGESLSDDESSAGPDDEASPSGAAGRDRRGERAPHKSALEDDESAAALEEGEVSDFGESASTNLQSGGDSPVEGNAGRPGEMGNNGEESALNDTAQGMGGEEMAGAEPMAPPIVPAFPARRGTSGSNEYGRIHFPFDSSMLDSETEKMLAANLERLKKNPELVIHLQGHADERGTSEYNLGLGMRRASAVREYLVTNGIEDDRLVTVTFGEEMPLTREHGAAAYRRNRRVEFSPVQATAVR